MAGIGQYLIGITAAALVCGMLMSLIGKKSPQAPLIRIVCGVFLTLCVVSPVKDLQFDNIGDYLDSLQFDSQFQASIGEDSYREQLCEIIKSNTEAYILDKAGSMGLSITVEVQVNDEEPPLPIAVIITGSVSSYNKKRLTDLIVNDLGIPEDAQTWR